MSDLIDGNLIDNNDEFYVDSNKAREFLNISDGRQNLKKIVEIYNVRVVKDGLGFKYNFNDLKAIMEEGKAYYSKYYTKEYITDVLGAKWTYDRFSKAKVTVPFKYNRILSRHLYLYDKDSVNTIIALDKGEERVVIKGTEYYSTQKVVEKLEILYPSKGIKSLKTEWGIKPLWMGSFGNFYKCSDIDEIKSKIWEYYQGFYSSEESAKLLNVELKYLWGLNENVLRKYKTDRKYNYFLRKENSLIKAVMYKKTDIDAYVKLKANSSKENILKRNRISEYTDNEYSVDGEDIYYLGVRYYNKKTTVERLEITKSIEFVMSGLNEDWGVESELVDTEFAGLTGKGKARLYNANQVDAVIEEIKDFASKNYVYNDVRKMLTEKQIKDNLTPVEAGVKYSRYMRKSCNFGRQLIYSKKEVEKIVAKYNNTYTMKYICEKFNLNMDRTRRLIEEYELEGCVDARRGRGVIVFFADKVDSLLAKKEEFFREYIPLTEIAKYFGVDKVSSHLYSIDSLDRYDIPFYAQDINHKSKVAFRRSDIVAAGESFQERKAISNLQNLKGNTDYGTFKVRLSNHVGWEGFDNGSDYTEKQWFSYVKDWVERTTMKGRRMDGLINRLVYCTPYIKEFLDRAGKNEIFELTTNEVNLALRSVEAQANYTAIYTFLREVAIDRNSKGYITKFKINGVETPTERFGMQEEKEENEIYSFEEYASVFNYCIDIQNRVSASLDEIREKESYVYVSTWLYVMLHLNNAWRNGDVKEFPKLCVNDILEDNNIVNIAWFKENRISLETARMVVFRVNQKGFEMSKTQVKGAFFCSDELAPAFATAILMLSLRHREIVNESETIMLFGTTYNEINKTMLKRFFKLLDVKKFVFGSSKFNKTVMTFIYYIANISGDSKALVYAMKLRAHIEAATTGKYYLKIDEKMIEELSRQLFRRGEFGYIPSLLVKKISGGKLSFDETTKEIEEVNKHFRDIVKLNTTIGFMNDLRNRKREVFQEINSMTLEAAQETYSNMFAMNLPCKDSVDVQCLFGRDNCRHTERECYDCEFHIPTIHMLSDLANRIKVDIKKCIEANTIAEKFKLSLSVERKKRVVIEAIRKFGKDVVYSYLNMSRDEFLSELEKVPLPNEIMKLGN